MPAISQAITLECISNPVGGDLIGTAQWTGFRSASSRRARHPPDARALVFEPPTASTSPPRSTSDRDPRALLVHEMNGAPLTPGTASRFASTSPNRHGMKLPKWIRQHRGGRRPPRKGYWVERGWSRDRDPAHDIGHRHDGHRGSRHAPRDGRHRVRRRARHLARRGPARQRRLAARQLRTPRCPADLGAVALRAAEAAGHATFRVRAYDGAARRRRSACSRRIPTIERASTSSPRKSDARREVSRNRASSRSTRTSRR